MDPLRSENERKHRPTNPGMGKPDQKFTPVAQANQKWVSQKNPIWLSEDNKQWVWGSGPLLISVPVITITVSSKMYYTQVSLTVPMLNTVWLQE